MKVEALICDRDHKESECEFTVYFSLIGEVDLDARVDETFYNLFALLNTHLIRHQLHKSVCCMIGGELVPLKYLKTDMAVQEVYDKVRGEQK